MLTAAAIIAAVTLRAPKPTKSTKPAATNDHPADDPATACVDA
jgi:hypothetical protein